MVKTLYKIKAFFGLNTRYKFEINDLIATIYLLCAVFGISGLNVTPLFLIGSVLGFVTCFSGRKINLVVLNGALFLLNLITTLKLLAICP